MRLGPLSDSITWQWCQGCDRLMAEYDMGWRYGTYRCAECHGGPMTTLPPRLPLMDRPLGGKGWLAVAAGLTVFGLLFGIGVETLWPAGRPATHDYCVGDPALGPPVCGNTGHCAKRFVDASTDNHLCPDSPDQRPGTYITVDGKRI